MTEFNNYSWEIKDGKATNKPIDDFNHFVDSLRYGLEQMMLNRGKIKISAEAKARAMRHQMRRR